MIINSKKRKIAGCRAIYQQNLSKYPKFQAKELLNAQLKVLHRFRMGKREFNQGLVL